MKSIQRSSYIERFIGPEVAASYENQEYGATSYASHAWEIQRPQLRALFLEISQRYPVGRHLDFACGTGRITKEAVEVFSEVDALDISEAMVEMGRKRCPTAHFFVGDILKTPDLCAGPYTSATSFRLLLNLDPPLRLPILRALHARLIPGGTYIANIHGNSRSLRQPAILWKRWRHPMDRRGDRMLNSMSPGEAVACLQEAGFELEERHGVGILPPTLYRWPLRNFWIGLDRLLSRIPFLQPFCVDHLYVCSARTAR